MGRRLAALLTVAGTATLPLAVAPQARGVGGGTWWSAFAGRAAYADSLLGDGRSADPIDDTASSLRIDCSSLGAESQGALEARARAEIVLAPRPAGEIAIECAAHSALVAWRAPGGGLRERRIALDDDPTTAVDGLLGAVHALRFENAPTEAISSTRVAAQADMSRRQVPAAVALRSRDPYRWGAMVGTEGELWRGAIRGAVAAQLGARLVASETWSYGLLAGVGWGWSTAGGIQANTLRMMANVAVAPATHLEFGLGAGLRVLSARVSDAAGSAERHAMTGGAHATARFWFALGPLDLALGPQIEVLAQPMIVQVAGQEVFRIPSLVTGFSVYGRGNLVH